MVKKQREAPPATRRVTVVRKSRWFKFIDDTFSELKKVVWLTRREVIYLTSLVLIVAVSTGLFLGAIDFGFTNLIDRLFIAR